MKVGMVSIYPPLESKHAKLGGVASYTKNLVVYLSNGCKVIVFADGISHMNNECHEGAMVCRCWKKGVFYPFQVFKRLLSNKIDIVHVQHEIYLYGGLGSAIFFPLLLFFIRLFRKPMVVTLHGVVPLSKVDRRFLRDNWTRGNPLIMRVGLILLVRMIAFLSTSIVVHEEKFKEMLRGEYGCPTHKVNVIHHGIEERNDLIEKDEAKENLGLNGKNVILFFGYITGYKNIELLIESANFVKTQDCVIVIAGGSHPRLSDDPNYRRYLSDLGKKASAISKDNILFRGFITEEKVPVYFSAADLVVFPYEICMHASGPLSLSISYEKPFLISDSFEETVASRDVVFANNPRDLASKIDQYFTDPNFRRKSLMCSHKFKTERSWSDVANKTLRLYKGILKQEPLG